MAKQDEQATGLGLDFKQVDVVDQIMGNHLRHYLMGD